MLSACGGGNNGAKSPGDYVDPNIGGVAPLLTVVTPQVNRPNSMVRIFPVTRPGLTDTYFSDRLYGINLNMPKYRMGGVTAIVPTSGELKTGFEESSSWSDHDLEEVHPWMHSVVLDDYGINAKWTSTERASIFDFTYNDGRQANILFRISAPGQITVSDNSVISGYESVEYAKQYFYAVLSQPFENSGTWKDGQVSEAKSAEGGNIGVWLTSNKAKNAEVRIGISYISVEQAKANLEKEVADKSFATVVNESRNIWENALGKIKVKGGTEREKRIFYTSLYRVYERMVNISEDGKYYSGFDRQVHEDEGIPFYNDDWIWDTYRNAHALRMILNPKQEGNMLDSYVRMYEQSGWVPNFPELTEWSVGPWGGEPMIGNHTSSIFAEALIKGVDNFDIEKAYEGARKNSLEGTMVPWRSGPAREIDLFYNENGYFPALAPGEDEPYPYVDNNFEKRQAVSVTLEHSYDDWCLAQIAKKLGKEDDYNLFMKRSENYLNLWNAQTGFFSPKNAKGEWIANFDPQNCDGIGARSYFAEVNAYVHAFHVQHNIPKLIELMGGNEKFIGRLDDVYSRGPREGKWRFMGIMPDATGLQGLMPAGNEPAFHVPYLYNYAGAPWKTQHRVRQIADVWFDDRVTGLPGDEDGGALCAWYVFSAMGFYPVSPVSGEYAIGSPIFEETTIDLPNGKTFTVKAPDASKKNKYIQSAKLNGKPLNRPFITHEDIMQGGTLEFVMGSTPNKKWGLEI